MPASERWDAAFARILAPLVDPHRERLTAPYADEPAVRAGFADALGRDLARLAARTLVLEVNVARVEERLTGSDPAERFAYFVERMARPEALAALLAEYPVLAELLVRRATLAADALAEMLARYAADRPALVAGLLDGADPGPLVEVRSGAGDTHGGGRSVAVLRFASGARVVYKPVSLAAHGHFNELAAWYSARLDDTLRVPALRLVPRGAYGWVEFAQPSPCADADGVVRFYRRQGALLALLYALDATDMHYENIVARGDDPVLVDVETLFHPALPPYRSTGPDPAADALTASVFRTCLLPRMILGDAVILDISALGGDRDAPMPYEAATWADAGTDRMRLVRATAHLAGADNRPVLDGADADPAAYAQPLLAGFRAGYAALVRHREELLAPGGPITQFADDEVRVVVRATTVYATLLEESTHPAVLRDRRDRDELLSTLADDGARPPLAESEIAQLWAGDVPIFHTTPSCVDLTDGRGVRHPAVLAHTGLATVVDKIARLGDEDRVRQEWVIRAALAARSTTHLPAYARGLPRPARAGTDRLLALAGEIGERLAALAYRDGAAVNWLGLEPAAERFWHLGPLGASLGTGYCGVALFLAQLDHLRGTARHADDVRRALHPVPTLLDALTERPELLAAVGSGAYAGLGGIAYALARIAQLRGEGEVSAWADRAVHLTGAATELDTTLGVADGTAGGLAALVAVHEITGSPTAWQYAEAAAKRVAAAPAPPPPGLARGRAGAGWALARYGEAGGGAEHVRHGIGLLTGAAAAGPALCEGLTGVALAATDLAAGRADGVLGRTVADAVRLLEGLGRLGDDSLCHGEAGALTLLRRLDRPGRIESVHCGTPDGVLSPGILTGLAGIGIAALELAFPQHVPSAVLLR